MATIFIKRVYEVAEKKDGFRVLVDRLWPRGITPQAANVAAWMKELAPSPCLRIWFKHHPDQWPSFCRSYLIELKVYTDIARLRSICKAHKKITLLYAAKDEMHNNAVVLQIFLNGVQTGTQPYPALFQLLFANTTDDYLHG